MEKSSYSNSLVSLVVITFNQENLIEDTLESISRQSYEWIEIIINDDASTDRTFSLIQEWAKSFKDKFIKVDIHKNEHNLGVSANLTDAVKRSTGKYIKCLGGDDILKDDAIEKMVGFALQTNSPWIMSRVGSFQHNIEDSRDLFLDPYFFWVLKNRKSYQLLSLLQYNFIFAPGVLIKRQLLEEVNYFGNGYRTIEDYQTWIRIMSNGYRLEYQPETLVFYRKHEGSIMGSQFNSKNRLRFEELIKIINEEIFPRIPWWAIGTKIHVLIYRWYNKRILKRGVEFSKNDKYLYCLSPIFWLRKMFLVLDRVGLLEREN